MKNAARTITKALELAAVLAASGFVVLFLVLVIRRLGYPFELEWQEGGVLDHIRRILGGQKIYTEPSLDFVAFIYTPLYYYLSASLSKLGGLGFVCPRVVSIISSMGCMALAALTVYRETKKRFPAAMAAGLFAAAYKVAGGWFDVARVDSLFVLFLLAAVYFLRFGPSLKRYLLAALLVSLAFFTKQSALVAIVPLAAWAVWMNRRLGAWFAGAVAVMVAGGALIFDFVHDGWFSYYVFSLTLSHRFEIESLAELWTRTIAISLPIAALFAVWSVAARFLGSKTEAAISYTFVLAALAGVSVFSSGHQGAWYNVMIPAIAAVSIFFGLGVSSALDEIDRRGGQARDLRRAAILAACVAQLGMLFYNPFSLLPTGSDLLAGRELVARLALSDKEVFVPRHGYLAWAAGKRGHAHEMAINDVLRGDPDGRGQKLRREIFDAISNKRFSAVVVNYDWAKEELTRYYRLVGPAFENDSVFWPVTGMRTRPEKIWVPVE